MCLNLPKPCKCGCGKMVPGKSRRGYVKYHDRLDMTPRVCSRGHSKQLVGDRWKCVECGKGRKLAKQLGISLDQFFAEEVHNTCDICGREPIEAPYQRLIRDHDHETNTLRGTLCGPCNRALGLLGDNLLTLQRAVKYKEYWG